MKEKESIRKRIFRFENVVGLILLIIITIVVYFAMFGCNQAKAQTSDSIKGIIISYPDTINYTGDWNWDTYINYPKTDTLIIITVDTNVVVDSLVVNVLNTTTTYSKMDYLKKEFDVGKEEYIKMIKTEVRIYGLCKAFAFIYMLINILITGINSPKMDYRIFALRFVEMIVIASIIYFLVPQVLSLGINTHYNIIKLLL